MDVMKSFQILRKSHFFPFLQRLVYFDVKLFKSCSRLEPMDSNRNETKVLIGKSHNQQFLAKSTAWLSLNLYKYCKHISLVAMIYI